MLRFKLNDVETVFVTEIKEGYIINIEMQGIIRESYIVERDTDFFELVNHMRGIKC